MSGAAFGGVQVCARKPLHVLGNGETVTLMHELAS